MTTEELNKRKNDMTRHVVTSGFRKAEERVPLFTERLIMWANNEGMGEALTEFLACFTEEALVVAIAEVHKDMRSITGQVIRAARRAKVHTSETEGEGPGDAE